MNVPDSRVLQPAAKDDAALAAASIGLAGLPPLAALAQLLAVSQGDTFWRQLALGLTHILDAPLVCFARLQASTHTPPLYKALVLAHAVDGVLQPPLELTLEGTPSQALLEQTEHLVPHDAQILYPTAPLLAQADMHSYFGLPLLAQDGTHVGLVCVMFRTALPRVDELRQILTIVAVRAGAELERQNADLRIREKVSLLDKARDAIMVRDLEHRITFWNQGAERMYGWTRAEALGRPITELLRHNPREFEQATRQLMKYGDWSSEITQFNREGRRLEVEDRWTLVRNDADAPPFILSINTDISQRKAHESQIHRLAYYDTLTQLPNRQQLMERIGQALVAAQRRSRGGALLFIDLDNFKALNDTLGHDQGDQLLRLVAQRLTSCVRSHDLVARLGGDEFVVLLENLDEDDPMRTNYARQVGEKILTTLSVPYALGAYQHRSTPSIGIALFAGSQSISVGTLLQQADLAMYQAKDAGRGTLRFFDPDMQLEMSERVSLESDLRVALAQQQFALHYQAAMQSDGTVFGAEALLRWQHPQRGMVSPATFIPLAEESGLILPLGRWVLHTACSLLAKWKSQPARRTLCMAVNVSSRQFRDPGFVDDVSRILAVTGAPPTLLKLELTESLLVEDITATIATMDALRKLGVGFSLDDFGTGYSSLTYLKRMPLEQLKIDQSFVRDLLNDPNDAAIVNTIIALAKSLNLETIAEGVETAEQRDWLQSAGCHAYQGYYFSRPLAEADLELFLCRQELAEDTHPTALAG